MRTKAPTHYLTVIIATLGTMLEWAEYTFYGYLAFKLSGLFFPAGNTTANILKTYGVFAIGYIMRPFGAVLYGHIGDCFGRKTALTSSIFLMGLSTLGIGCLPAYESIGLLAPIGLLILRILQGLAISGEYNGAGIFLIEKLEKSRSCFAGSCITGSAAGGMVLGGLAAYLISLPGAPDFAWRIPFMLGGLSCLLSGYVRRNLSESPEFIAAQQQKRQKNSFPIVTVLQHYKQPLLIVFIIAAFTGIFVYIGNIYLVIFLQEIVGLPIHDATFFAMAGEAIAALSIPIMGLVADHHQQPERQFKIGLIITSICAPLMFSLAYTGNYYYISLAMLLFGLSNAIVSSPTLKLLYDQFPTELRYTGISVSWSVSIALFGGTAPMVAHYLASTWNWWVPSLYISTAALLALLFFSQCTLKKRDIMCFFNLA